MPDPLDPARKAIEQRLRELDSEAKRLREALEKLDAGSGNHRSRRRTSRPRRAASRPRRTARRARRGQRQEQFLKVVGKNPGAKAPAIAKEMGVQPSHVYTLARRMVESGQVTRRRGGGYAVKK